VKQTTRFFQTDLCTTQKATGKIAEENIQHISISTLQEMDTSTKVLKKIPGGQSQVPE
jgi:hypothetical protein